MPDNYKNLMTSPDCYAALYGFACKFTQPPINPEYIYQGGQNKMTTPAGCEDYALISIDQQKQIGTGVELCRHDRHGIYWERVAMMQAEANFDFYSNSGIAVVRAQSLNAAISGAGQSFLKSLGISLLYQGACQDISFNPSKGELIKRHRVTMHISYELRFFLGREAAEEVLTRRQENIDVHHRPALTN